MYTDGKPTPKNLFCTVFWFSDGHVLSLVSVLPLSTLANGKNLVTLAPSTSLLLRVIIFFAIKAHTKQLFTVVSVVQGAK